jgi:hypothetical protein
LTGRAAEGVPIPARERIQLTVALKDGVEMITLQDVHALLEKLLPGRIVVIPLLDGVQPDDGVEVFLD